MQASLNDKNSAVVEPHSGCKESKINEVASQSIIQSVLKAEIRKLQDNADQQRKKNEALEQELSDLRETLDKLAMQETVNKNNAENKAEKEPSSSSRFRHDFDVKRILGVGGFGIVFAVTNSYDGWKYAVKRLSVESNGLEEALDEVRAMAQFDHPGIVGYNSVWVEEPELKMQRFEDFKLLKECADMTNAKVAGEYEKHIRMNWQKPIRIYIQMQLCDYSLSDWLTNNVDPMARSVSRMKSWFKQMVASVNYMHKKNKIHRDLKPGNILFADDDLLKLCDLGIATAREVDGHIGTVFTRTEAGSDLYMSPEQFSGRYSSKTDVFTLGLILAEMCTVIDVADRTRIFDNYRKAAQPGIVEDIDTDAFVGMLTNIDPDMRPTCQGMLDHVFLRSI